MKPPTPHPSADRLKSANTDQLPESLHVEMRHGQPCLIDSRTGHAWQLMAADGNTAVLKLSESLAPGLAGRYNSHSALVAALGDLFAMMDEGLLVRNTRNDADSGWAIKQLRFVSRLKAAHSALALATSTSKEGE